MPGAPNSLRFSMPHRWRGRGERGRSGVASHQTASLGIPAWSSPAETDIDRDAPAGPARSYYSTFTLHLWAGEPVCCPSGNPSEKGTVSRDSSKAGVNTDAGTSLGMCSQRWHVLEVYIWQMILFLNFHFLIHNVGFSCKIPTPPPNAW